LASRRNRVGSYPARAPGISLGGTCSTEGWQPMGSADGVRPLRPMVPEPGEYLFYAAWLIRAAPKRKLTSQPTYLPRTKVRG